MKKSEQYKTAALAVMDHELIQPAIKLEIIDTLMQDRRLAIHAEEWETKQIDGSTITSGTVAAET